MADRSSHGSLTTLRIGAIVALAFVSPLALSTGTLDAAPSVQEHVAQLSASVGSLASKEDGTEEGRGFNDFADAVAAVKPAVISVRARVVAEGHRGAGAPLDRSRAVDRRGGASSQERRVLVSSQGSGFFISADGYAVTNAHVIGAATNVEIITDDQMTYRAKVVAADPASDLALIKVDGRTDFVHVKFADRSPRVGQRIFAVGNPFGLDGTVTAGIVSARARMIGAEESPADSHAYDDLIQIDAAINRGNSGGPSFDMQGNVIGVNTVILSPTGGSVGIGFAIPAETARIIVTQLKETGTVTRGWLGAQFQPLTPAIADALGLPGDHGALVTEPLAGGPANRAGIAAGDVIASIDGAAVQDPNDLRRKMIGRTPGTVINIEVVHDGANKSVAVTLGAAPRTRMITAGTEADSTQVPPTAPNFGLMLASAADAPELTKGQTKGVVVIGIDPSGPAGELGIQPGDVILDIGGKAVQTADDFTNALKQVRSTGRRVALMRLKTGETTRFIAVPVDGA
jgi:serine protease Do